LKYSRSTSNPSHITFADIAKSNARPLILLAIIGVVVLCAILAIVNAAGRSGFRSSFLVTGDTIKIGIRTDIEGFGYIDENGEMAGFDRDVVDEVLSRLLPGTERLIEYTPITSQDAGASIKYGNANICLGILTEDTSRTKGFRLTDPYYTDSVVAVVQGSSRLDRLANMDGGKLGILNGVISEEEVEEYLKKNDMNYELLRYSDYESAMTDIEHGRVNVVVMPYAIARQFEASGFRILAEPLYGVGYHIMLPTGQAAFANEMSKVIREMEQDGTLEELRRKWGL
jgi:ABC-type amino acid transport substrate-binding protein